MRCFALLQLKSLYLTDNKIGDKGATCLATCLPDLEELLLSACHITSNGAKEISKAIQRKHAPVSNDQQLLEIVLKLMLYLANSSPAFLCACV